MAMAPVEVLVGNFALDETTVADVVRLSITILLGASGIVAWIFSKRARARSSLGRMGVDISDASLARCIADGDLKAIELLLRTGIRADAPLNGRTPLQAAIKAGDERVIGLLVRRAPPEAVVRELLRDSVPEAAPSGSPAFTVLPGVQGVLEHIQHQIISALDSGERTEMLNLGLDLEVVQTFLLYKLIFQKNLRNLEYHGMLIESSAERIKPVIDGGSSIHSGTATAVIEKIGNQIAENAAFLDSSNISIEIRSYDLPPVLHGFLVDNRHLYLGFTEFVQGKLHGGEFGYLYLDRLAADPMTAHLFRVYRSWFEFQWNHGTKLCAS